MAETVPGGAYQNPDGSWHDANGKPISSSKVAEAEATKKAQQFQLEPVKEAPAPPPVENEEEEQAAGKRGSRSKKV